MAKARAPRAARTRTYVSRHCEERSDESIHLTSRQTWIASRSPSSGARSRDPLGRNAARSLRRDREAVSGTAPPRQSKIHGIQVLTFAIPIAISMPPGTSGLLAFGLESQNDGIDTIERRPRRAPQAAVVSLLASRHPRDGSHARPLCGRRDRGPYG